MRQVVAAAVAALATVALLGALTALVEARAGLATALLAAAVALLVTRPLQSRLRSRSDEPEHEAAPLEAAVREEERATLSADLHDRVGPALAGLKLSVAARRRAEPRVRPEVTGAQLAQQATGTADELRHVLAGLGPAATRDRGLREAIELLAGRLAPDGTPAITVRSPTDLGELPPDLEATAYAIAVEALTNAVRHARAQHIAVEIAIDDGLRLVISDDGIGLPHNVAEGVGLASMRRRAGGELAITRPPGGGTRIEISRLGRDEAP